jgi:hypothetical protein
MRRGVPLAGLIAVLALGTAVPAGALASGSYTVSACSPTTSPGAWQQVSTFPTGMTSGNQCGGPMIGPIGGGDAGALYGEDLVGFTNSVPAGAQAGWSFTAPAGTTITAVSYYRSLDTGNDGDWIAGLLDAGGARLDICHTNPTPCSDPNNQVAVTLSGLSSSGLFFGVECAPVAPDTDCLAGSTQHFAQADMYSVKVTLAETATPAASNFAGALWGGGVVWGSAPVTFDASDSSGIAQVAVDGPGGQVALQPQSCDYSQTQPCPQLPNGSLNVDTTQLHDGPQTLTLLVNNAAGNTLSVQSPSLVIDNNGPPPPGTLAGSPVAGNDNAIQLTWSDPANPPEPVTAAYAQICQGSCPAAIAVSFSGSAQLSVPGPGTYGVRLWLIDSAGRGGPANAATTTVVVPSPSVTGPTGPTGSTGLSMPAPAPALRLSHRLAGRLLTLTVRLPKGASSAVTVVLRAYHGAYLFALRRRHVKARHGVATVRFELSSRELHATKVSLSATVAHATSKTITLKHLPARSWAQRFLAGS